MNIKTLTLSSNKTVLVNFDNSTEIHGTKSGCTIYFNTMADEESQSCIEVCESIGQIISILNIAK